MKVLVALASLSFIATVIGLASVPLTVDISALEKITRLSNGRASNALGDLIAKYINNFVADLGDPVIVLNETSVPIFLNDSIHISGVVNASDVELAGISLLNITDSLATLLPLGGEFGFYLPEITVSGGYLIDLLETSLFPLTIYGEGPFSLKISSTTLYTKVRLGTTLTGHLKINSLTYEVDVYELKARIDGLFSDIDASGELNEAVNILFNSYASILFNLFESNLHDNVTELIKEVGNEILADLTLAEIIEIIGGGGIKGAAAAPIELFNLPTQY